MFRVYCMEAVLGLAFAVALMACVGGVLWILREVSLGG